jgi:hypothetical protein
MKLTHVLVQSELTIVFREYKILGKLDVRRKVLKPINRADAALLVFC